MVKKGLMIGAGVALLLALLFGRDAASYVSTSVGWARDGKTYSGAVGVLCVAMLKSAPS